MISRFHIIITLNLPFLLIYWMLSLRDDRIRFNSITSTLSLSLKKGWQWVYWGERWDETWAPESLEWDESFQHDTLLLSFFLKLRCDPDDHQMWFSCQIAIRGGEVNRKKTLGCVRRMILMWCRVMRIIFPLTLYFPLSDCRGVCVHPKPHLLEQR